MAKSWEEKFNQLLNKELKVDENKKWKMALEEHKERGTLQMNVRLWKETEAYTGPTKSGFIVAANSAEDIKELQTAFNEFFEDVIKFFD